ncbi:MAG: phosphoglycerate kinase [Sulfurovum sp.]|nr:phosphoglycerate kinase [Sulfurovum sp.]
MNLKTIKDLEIEGKRVFIRCDFNVPKDENGNITDDRRIRSALQTIKYCIDRDCKIVLASHYERPEAGVYEEKFSLSPVAKRLHILLNMEKEIFMATDVIGEDAQAKAKALKAGEILLLENLRYEAGETSNDSDFAQTLAGFGEFYINDAFGACHRKHASIYAITEFFDLQHKAGGFLMSKEINFFSKVLENPVRPFVAVIGGSKISGKLEAMNKLVDKVDKIIIGGGMAFTFLKAQGHEIGTSLFEAHLVEEAKNIMQKAKNLGVKFYLPVDVVVADRFSENATVKFLPIQEIPEEWMGLDIGPASTRLFREALNDAQTIIWNGPMGVYEMDRYSKGSFSMSHTISQTHATTIVGGGDTADVVLQAGDADDMTFISTGGGASLKLIEGIALPGIEALCAK